MVNQCAVRKDGRLLAVVGVTERRWVVPGGGGVLRFAGIGNVCTHPALGRGGGYFRLLMDHVVATIKQQGYHGSVLGGDRQRYGYFGCGRPRALSATVRRAHDSPRRRYDKCGVAHSFSITRTNCRRHFTEPPAGSAGLRLEPVGPEETGRLEACRALQRGQLAFYDRDTSGYTAAQAVALYTPHLHAAVNGQTGEVIGCATARLRNQRDDATCLKYLRVVSLVARASWICEPAEQSRASVCLPPPRLLTHTYSAWAWVLQLHRGKPVGHCRADRPVGPDRARDAPAVGALQRRT